MKMKFYWNKNLRYTRNISSSECGCDYKNLIFVLWILIFINIFNNVGTIPSTIPSKKLYSLPLTREDYISNSNINNNNNNNNNIRKDKSEWVWDLEPSGETFILNKFCKVGASLEKVVCYGLNTIQDLPIQDNYFLAIRKGIFVNIMNKSNIKIYDLQKTFPNLKVLTFVQSSNFVKTFLEDISDFSSTSTGSTSSSSSSSEMNRNISYNNNNNNNNNNKLINRFTIETNLNESHHSSSNRSDVQNLIPSFKNNINNNNIWSSIQHLNISRNELNSNYIPTSLMRFFPNLNELDLAGNNITTLSKISSQDWNKLTTIDLSENPLDCTSSEMEWVERPNITLLNIDDTLCDHPPHQNKPKPILQTIHLIKKVKAECRLNCSCQIDYIWEQDKVVHSKTSVNCSNRNFIDFPDPDKLPQPTDTLYLNENKITSIKKFVDDHRYTELNVKNLYLDDNQISSIETLESSDWIYTFQVLSLRNNNLSQVPIHLLENILRQNKWIYFIDLSGNDWMCECRTVSTFKVWLLRHSKFVKHIENVRCGKTGREIRYLKNEDWCKREEVSQMIELLDCLSIFLALLILLVISKVIYDYWKLKKYGKIPWIVSKM